MDALSFSINFKWPAARLFGPKVRIEHALEFIRRTDPALVGITPENQTNDREFAEELIAAFPTVFRPYDEVFGLGPYDHALHEAFERYRANFGHLRLNYLASHWVASCYIGGPHGPVHPDGTVWLDINFGKWAIVEEVEEDLVAIAANFPWLSFVLAMWDEEGFTNDFTEPPCCVWKVRDSRVIRSSLDRVSEDARDAIQLTPYGLDTDRVVDEIRMGRREHETTWTVPEIVEMWGERIESAMRAALEPPPDAD